ncbi:hypothetical protein LWI29_033747 [Acer saccharum]|uniref:7-deoxyloganetic acid glucosyltransferase n=1 Tax=Acer saccharum TaxID=4024 RepID=A0AA39VPL3_ACESA|nr:hypothetical protein LWI29_033747 [Acer saccharum]
MEQTNVPHVMFLPFPAQGHIKPMMKLAELLNQAGSQVTFVNTDRSHDLLMSHTDLTSFDDRSPNFLFRSIPDGLRPDRARSLSNFKELLDTLQAVAKPAFRQLLISTSMRPTCIIADGIMSFAAIDVAEELEIPVVAFRTHNACCIWTYFHLSKLVEAGEVPFPDENLDKYITCIPGYENVLRSRDLPNICRVENPGYSFLDFFIREASTMTRASALILNTFHELEAPVISRLNSIFTKIYTIGPLHALYKSRTKDLIISQSDSSNSVGLWKEDRSCMTWLDSQPLRSVIYVSFGSLVNLTRLQTLEFLHGLVNSGKPFLWVVRPDLIVGEFGIDPMELEMLTKERGFIVSWAPQEEGYIKPMMKLAELLNQAGSKVTFVNTDHNHDRLISHNNLTSFHDRSPNFLFRSIPNGLRPNKARSLSNFIESMDALQAVVKLAFRELLISTTDDIMLFAAIDVAEELGIPVITFRTYNASCTWTYFHLSKLVEAGEVPFPDENLDKYITCIPGYENVLRSRDLPNICRVENPGYSFLDFFIREASTMTRASALILNTFHELEAPVISRLNSIFTKIYTIGPLHALYKSCTKDLMISQLDSSNGVGLWKEDKSCMTWLDSQPLRSVIYVSFGSLVNLTRLQTLEFLHGLVNSGKPFLWVVRPDLTVGEFGIDPMELKMVTKERGFIVSWAPQEEVLAHPAVGGFLTHSGWNSTPESINAGVPMICWPQIADQPVNSRCVSEVWKIGFDMKDTCDRSTVEKLVTDLIENEREDIMKSTDKFARLAGDSVKQGGSSYSNLDKLIEDLRSLSP